MFASLLLPLFVVLVQGSPADEVKTALPPGLVARIDGRPVTLEAYRDWLVSIHGPTYLDDYLALVLLRAEAARLEISISEKDLDGALDEDWKAHLMRFGGDESRWLQELAAGGMTPESYRRTRRWNLESEVLARKIVPTRRKDDEAVLRQLFIQQFGEAGVRIHLQLAFFDKFRDLECGQPIREEKKLQQFDAQALERAQAFLAEARKGPERFAELTRKLSDPLAVPRGDGWTVDLREAGGDLPRYTKKHFGGTLEKALEGDPEPGSLIGPFLTHRGYYVIRFLERAPVTYEQVVDELRRINHERPATPREIHELKTSLLEKASIEVTDHWPGPKR